MRLHCRLRELRGSKPLKQMARETGINRGYLSRYETGKELPRDHHVATLIRHYGGTPATWYTPHVVLELTDDSGERLNRREAA